MKKSILRKIISENIEVLKEINIFEGKQLSFTLGKDKKSLYIDNLTDNDVDISKILKGLKKDAGNFVSSISSNTLTPDNVIILKFEDVITPNILKKYNI